MNPVAPHTTGGKAPARSAPIGLRLVVSNDTSGRLRVSPSLHPRAAKRKRGKPWKLVARGSTTVKIYATRKRHAPYTITWRDSALGQRQRAMRSDPFVAVSFAEQKATDLANGEAWRAQLGHADWATYQRCKEMLNALTLPRSDAPTSIELAVSVYVDIIRKLPADVTPAEAISFFLANRPGRSTKKNCPEIFDELLIAREKDGASQNTLDDLKSRVAKFVAHFTGPIQDITATDINTWLRALPGSRRTRNNYRGNIVDFYRFARQSGYVAKTWNPLDDVPRAKNEPVRIIIFTPEEITRLLAARFALEESNPRAKRLVPFMVVGAFAGVRHEEMCAAGGLPVLDWRQIDLEKGEIHVLAEVARKKGCDRITPIQPNLSAWLQRYAKTSGPVCELDNATNGLRDAAARAGLAWKDNGLRKSFISYRLALTENIGTVATEAGTSPDRIRHNYKKTVPKREATRWFNIIPTQAEILQLNFSLA